MIDEELALQFRDVTGDAITVCERCGRPMTRATSLSPELVNPGALDEVMLLCGDCIARIERGDVVLEDELAPDDEP